MQLKDRVKILVIDSIDYLMPIDFAYIVGQTTNNIYQLMKRGNSIRPLKSCRINGMLLIPLTELTAYPFTLSGNNRSQYIQVYHFDIEGNKLPVEIVEKAKLFEPITEEQREALRKKLG